MDNSFINRAIAPAIRDAFKYFSVITITGPRQSGKTSLIRKEFSEYSYYSLEDLDILQAAKADPRGFLQRDIKGCIIDEAQNAPELLSYIQGVVDDNPQVRYILSGSSNFGLLNKVTQSLAGRTAIFELLPLSINEVQQIIKDKSLDELLFEGLYPAICSGKNIAKYLYPAYIKTYLERDIRDTLNVKDLLQFDRFVRLCAGRIGSIFNASELSNEVGASVNTINSWLSVLVSSYIVFLLPPYFENTTKRLIKSPKLYFCDTGLACSLLGINSPEQLSTDKMRGHLFENMIIIEKLKERYNSLSESNLYFYRDSNHNEIDLVEVFRNGVILNEIKSSSSYSNVFERTLQKSTKLINAPTLERRVIYSGLYESLQSDIKVVNYLHLM